jgi:hypothetical protein
MHHPILRLLSLFLIASLLSAASACTEATPPPPAISQPEPAKQLIVDRVVVVKSSHTLELHHEGQVLETFPVSLGPHLHGPKREAGDGRTPEGVYRIDWRSLKTRRKGPRTGAGDACRTRWRNFHPRRASRLRTLRSA